MTQPITHRHFISIVLYEMGFRHGRRAAFPGYVHLPAYRNGYLAGLQCSANMVGKLAREILNIKEDGWRS
jgi:hypothetical protein